MRNVKKSRETIAKGFMEFKRIMEVKGKNYGTSDFNSMETE